MKMGHMQHSSSLQPDQLQQQQLQQHSSSGAANSTGTGKTERGGMAQVRFQPRIGNLLAAASDKVVSIFDIETDRQTYSFQGHAEMVNYICHDGNGDYLASVSQNLVKIWSLVSGECIQELGSNGGNQFHSCVFHPSYSTLLIVGEILAAVPGAVDIWLRHRDANSSTREHNFSFGTVTCHWNGCVCKS
ncbi:Transcriptional corepressor LEUNIG [Morella rubra]|uniref:Transcriptional corepressor LEUNIG n=1 Tax=Morella rubra TaxID=262757 RepID=A0A6A1WRB6_9ROSI|nr:Transcriptional corepressor LEUNIG [Morella rubra]